MNFCRKQKGVVSIFLVIILVPMITISSLFVDVSKVMLGRSVVDAAGDLALNTALTNYDTVLKDMYGLFATAQDTEELYIKLEDYYRSCITSSGVSTDVAETYAEQLMSQLGVVAESNNVDDILNMELTDFSASKYKGASLANATVLKKQIIEFQKYRAPINTGLSFLTSLQSFATIEKQTELVEKRTDYYEAEQSVMGNAQLAWQAISRYEKSGILDNNFLSKVGTAFGYDSENRAYNYQNQYQYFVTKIIMDLYDTENYLEFNAKTYEIVTETITYNEVDKSVYMFYKNSNKTSKEKPYTEYTTYSDEEKASANNIKSKLQAFWTAYNNYTSAKSVIDNLPVYNTSTTYKIQYLVQVQRSNVYNTWITAMQNLYKAYSELEHAVYYAGVTVVEQDGEDVEVSVLDTKEKLFDSNTDKTYRTYYNEFVTKFYNTVTPFNDTLSNLNSNLDKCENGCKTTVTTLRETIKTQISDTYTEICNYRKTLVDAQKELNTAKTYLGYVYDGVKDGGTLDVAKCAWENVADDDDLKNTATAKQDLAEIENLADQFDAAEVQKLISRVTNIINHLENMISQIDSYTFYGVNLTSIDSYDTLEWLVRQAHGDDNLKSVSTYTSELQTFVENAYAGKFIVSSKVDVSWTNDSGTQPDLHSVDKLNFYTYLYTHFRDSYETLSNTEETKTQDQKDAEALYDNIKKINPSDQDDSDKAIDSGSKVAINEITSIERSKLPSGGAGAATEDDAPGIASGDNAAKNTSDSLGGLFGSSFLNAVKNVAEDLRDNLYVSDYILGMFSYDTCEAEYLKEHEGETEAKLVSLTQESINATNNYMYGGEVEYIIYGGKDATNKMISYGTIYGIRLAFNLVYAFTDAEIRDGAFAMATPISAATLGVVPVPLIQAAIIIAISCCESALDIGTIKAGEEVPLFKNKQSWVLDFNSLLAAAKTTGVKIAKKVVNTAVDAGADKISEYLDMSAEELNIALQNGTTDLEKYFKDSCKTMVERHAGTAIQKFTTLTQTAVDEAILNPGLNVTEYIKTELDTWLQQEAQGIDVNSDLAYQAKKIAVDVIKENYVEALVTELQKDYVPDSDEVISTTLDAIFVRINGSVTEKLNERMESMIETANSELKDAMNESADKVKETLNKQLDKFSGGSTGNGLASDNTGVASLISFSYSDYLRLFTIIGLYTDEEEIILRTADVIQQNMGKVTGNSDYALSEAAAYVEVTATVLVKPTFLPMPLFSDVENNPATNSIWYTIEYSEIKGY